MLPWSAFGHIIPFSQLAVSLVRSGLVRVSFLSTPGNLRRIPKLPPDVSPDLLRFIPLPLADVKDASGSPLRGEATMDVAFDEIQYLKVAYDLLREPLAGFLEVSSPDILMVDFASPWAKDLVEERGIPMMMFSIFPASALAFLMHPDYLTGERRWETPESLTIPPPWGKFPPSIAYRLHEAIGLHGGIYSKNASDYTDAERLGNVLKSSAAITIRSCPEFDRHYLETIEENIGKPVIPVGFLPRDKSTPPSSSGSRSPILEWLDGKTENSVVFVAFGSELQLTKEHIHEIALGLELSGIPFVWALRRPSWARHIDQNDEEKLAEAILPPGLLERTSSSGKVCFGWVPQFEIMSHPTIGGTLTHSAWGSVIETLQFGYPLVLLPFGIDQPLIARDMVHRGLGVEVERAGDGQYTREGVASALRFTMVSVDGEKLREKCKEQSELFGDQELHQAYVIKFIQRLQSEYCPAPKHD
ncbi:hypothetical protein MLD38_018779 [Melastoma candidum]|uniref:Uncharacterized protein n=1 Tax=Melastoma candidum TaxID=119954 RepID=A0ACB9QUU1_9MYRT|nr:hypothetical protein MLD38_018779 [Melastoma candidum]